MVGFKDAILAEKDRFVRGFAGHLLSFAMARELGPQDQSELDRIAAATIADDYAKEILSIYEPKIYSLGKLIAPLSSFKLRKISNSLKRPDTYEHDILELMGDKPEFE